MRTARGASACRTPHAARPAPPAAAHLASTFRPRLRRLTEFSCGARSDGRSTADHNAFMRAVVPLLDAAPFVQRYFWMAARDSADKRNLVVAGSSGPATALTPLGRLYLSL